MFFSIRVFVGNSFIRYTTMRIFSSFDTEHKKRVIDNYIATHWSENILVLSRSKLYLRWRIYIRIAIYTILLAFWLYLIFTLTKWPNSRLYLTIIITIPYIVSVRPIIWKYIDYKMDFVVVTPTGVFFYNQRWFLYREMSALNLQNIRSVNIQKSRFLYTLFDNGDIIFLSEWQEIPLWEILIRYIADPEGKKDQIQRIFEISRQTPDE